MGECVLAVHLGATISDLAEVVKGHPTLSQDVHVQAAGSEEAFGKILGCRFFVDDASNR